MHACSIFVQLSILILLSTIITIYKSSATLHAGHYKMCVCHNTARRLVVITKNAYYVILYYASLVFDYIDSVETNSVY